MIKKLGLELDFTDYLDLAKKLVFIVFLDLNNFI